MRLQGEFRRGGQDYIHRDNRNFMKILFFPNIRFFPFFYVQRNISGCSLKTLWRGCNHCIFRVHRNLWRKNKKRILQKKNKFFTILGDCCEENFGGVVKTAFTGTIGFLCRPFFWIICFIPFLYFERKIFSLSSKTVQRGCNHYIHRVYRIILRKIKNGFFERVLNLYPSRRLQGKFRRGGQDWIHRDKRNLYRLLFEFMLFSNFL